MRCRHTGRARISLLQTVWSEQMASGHMTRGATGDVDHGALRQHERTMVGTTIAFTVVAIVDKGGIDLLVPVVLGWLGFSLFASSRTRSVGSFAAWNVPLLIADSVLDIVAMGTHLPVWIGPPVVLPWDTASWGGHIGVVAYWILLWGLAVPSRTLTMLDRLPHTAFSERAYLFVAVIGLHVLFVEDVIYFAILGYPPLVSTPPENYVYLPHPGWMPPWTASSVWVAAAIGSALYVGVTVALFFRQRRAGGRDGSPDESPGASAGTV